MTNNTQVFTIRAKGFVGRLSKFCSLDVFYLQIIRIYNNVHTYCRSSLSSQSLGINSIKIKYQGFVGDKCI